MLWRWIIMKLKNDTKEKNSLYLQSETDDDRLNLKYQDKKYNESYKQWRLKNKDSLGFFFVENPNRLTYQDDVGFIYEYPEVQEEKTLRRAVNVLGYILILRALFEIFFIYVFPRLLEMAGIEIRYDIFTGKLYGDDMLILTVKFISGILAMMLPISILIKQLGMPFRVMLPMKITNKPMFRLSVPIMLLICGVCSIMSTLYEYLLGLVKINTERSIIIPENVSGIIYLIITQIIIIPTVNELCARGVVLQFTRQFGDGIAIVISSFVTAAMSFDITKFCFVFIAAVAISYFTIRTGSVITAVVMRITMQAFAYVLYFLDYRTDSDMLVMLFMLITITTGFIFTVYFLYKHSDRFGMKLSSRYMTYGRKLLAFFTSIPIIIWLTADFIISLFNIKFQ